MMGKALRIFALVCHLFIISGIAGSRYYQTFIKAIGSRHVSYLHSSNGIIRNAIQHEIDVTYRSTTQQGQNFPFLICSKYFESKSIKEILSKQEYHVTYSSMRDSLCCFVHYSTIEQYLHVNSTLVSSAVFIHVPIPSILKFDQSIQALLYFSSILDSRKNLSSMDLHLLDSILSGRQAGISVTFKRSCSQTHQDESLLSWIKLFIDKDGDSIMRSLFWYSEKFQPTGSMSRIRGRNDVDPFLLHRKWRQWSDFDWNFHFNHSIQLDMEKALRAAKHRRRSTYIPIPASMLNYLLSALHPTNLDFSPSYVDASGNVSNSDIFAAFFARIVSVLATDGKVTRISLSRPMKPLNKNARAITQSGVLDYEPFSDAGLTGSNMVVGVSDTGIDENSCYFKDGIHGKVPRSDADLPFFDNKYRKVIQYVNWSGSGGDYRDGHGSHVAGTLAGQCSASHYVDYRGIASNAKIAFFDIGINDHDEDLSIPYDLSKYLYPPAYAAGARVHSNSWGGGYWYDSYCIDTDEYLFQNQDVAVFFAGGNDGSSGVETVLSPALSKNVVAVGCTSNLGGLSMDVISSFSSIGPTPDGRIKPDILAPGNSIYSVAARSENSRATDPDCALERKAGTSMSAPVAAANALLIRQYFMDSKFWAKYCRASNHICRDGAFNPSGVLLKAVLLHSGVQVSSRASSVPVHGTPDNYQGYGRINLLSVLPLSSSSFSLFVHESKLAQMQMHTFTVTVSSQSKPLKVTLSWYDPPNEVFSAKYLLHDLDILVTDPSGKTFYGNAQGSKRDELNNNEQVLISTPTSGAWAVSVQSKLLSESIAQNYSLVITVVGVVDSNVVTTDLNPSDFSYCPPSASDSGRPRMELDLALFSRLMGGGWGNGDTYTISSQSSGVAVFSGTFSSSPSTVSLKESSSCLPTGCYSVNFNMVGRPTSVRGSNMAIPQCGIFLTALASTQSFCISAPGPAAQSNPDNSTDNSYGKCTPQCLVSDHVLVPILPFEDQGSGWSGAYYFIQPIGASNIPSGDRASALSAGTLESGYGELKFQCLPLQSQCYTLQLSFASEYLLEDYVEFPQIFIPDAHQNGDIHSPIDLLDLVHCPYQLNISFPIAKFCVDENDNSGHGFVTFYGKKDNSPFTFANFGMLPESASTLVMMQSSQYLTPIGKCVINIIQVKSPTPQSSRSPTVTSSVSPTVYSTTTIPSSDPTAFPLYLPSSIPVAHPSDYPTCKPSTLKSTSPTCSPSMHPSSVPSGMPTFTAMPSIPSSSIPSYLQSSIPTLMPSDHPTLELSVDPTSDPSAKPSTDPSLSPITIAPTVRTESPSTEEQLDSPTQHPSVVKTITPSALSTSMHPTTRTASPSRLPSFLPSRIHSSDQSIKPVETTTYPTKVPLSTGPSALPTAATQSQGPTISDVVTTHPSAIINSKGPSLSPSVAIDFVTTAPTKSAPIHSNLNTTNAIVVCQIVDDITLESFQPRPTSDSFTLTVAQIFNVSIASITILNITRVSKEGLQFKKYIRPAVLVKYQVFVTLVTQSVDFSAQQLTNAVSSGYFTAKMHENALKHNVTALLIATTSSVSIMSGITDPPTETPTVPIQTSTSNPSGATSYSKEAVIVVVVGAVCFVLFLVGLVYYIFSIAIRNRGYENLKSGGDPAEVFSDMHQHSTYEQIELVEG